MAEPYLGEIRIMSFGFAPKGWALCNGQELQINQNQALYSLLGTTYGGDGQTSFALPDLRGRVPIHVGNGHSLGELGGEPAHTLSIDELPSHAHIMQASGEAANRSTPGSAVFARSPAANIYREQATSLGELSAAAVANTGGSQAHLNMQPFLTLSFCIALQGLFPTQS